MPVIVPANQLNVSALTADDLYISILNPPGYISGVPTDVIGVVGTAAWGPVNKAVHLGSSQDGLQNFGPISAASLTDPHDLATDLAIAFGQASSQASLEGWAVRVTDGTDVAATGSITGTASAAGRGATIGGTVTTSDVISLIATSSAITGSPVTVSYTAGAGDTLTTIATGLAAAVNANAALKAAGIYAQSAAAVVSLWAIATLSPAVTWTSNVTGAATETVTFGAISAASAGIRLSGIFTGSLGNVIQANVALGAAANTFTVILNGPGNLAEYYPNLPSATFWTALAAAINNGLSGVRGPSQIAKADRANIAVGAPTVGLYTLSGGTDGRAVNTAALLGTDSNPGTGLYALRQLKPAVGLTWIVGLTDSSAFAASLAFGLSEGSSTLLTLPAGTSTSAALTAVSNNGIADPSVTYVKDWHYFFDPVNGVTRLVPPTAFIGGTIATLAPQVSPSNKPVLLVVGTERSNQWTGTTPYTTSEVGQLESAGIMFVTRPIPAGNQWGIRHGQTTSLQPVTQPFEWWRMTIFLARSFAATMGVFVGQNQSQQPNDPTRAAVRLELNNFLNNLKSPSVGAGDGLGQIDDFTVVCGFSQSGTPGLGINTPTSIAQHYLYALVKVRYLSSIRFFILSLQGGTTVVTVNAGPGQDLIQQAA